MARKTTSTETVLDAPEASTVAGKVAKARETASRLEQQRKREAREQKKAELAALLEQGQLALWPDSERGLPNELARCAVFSAKNKKVARQVFLANDPLKIPVIGGGEVCFIGEELRQDDETVWMELVHRAKEARSEWIEFAPHELLQTLRWPTNGDSYRRLLAVLRRLHGATIEVYSERLDRGLPTRLLQKYQFSKDRQTPWRVHVFSKNDDLLMLFDRLYTRVDWERRLDLPPGVATWLHTFFCSHREPFAHKLETLAIGAGMKLFDPGDEELDEAKQKAKRKQRMREIRRTIGEALDALVGTGFLVRYEIKRGLVHVWRNEAVK